MSEFDALPLTLDQWAGRDLPARDWLLGRFLATTSRGILSAQTGLGKTHLLMALGIAIAGGRPFCHWDGSGTPRRVLIVDGEMPRELVQERLADAAARGGSPVRFYCVCREDAPNMPPLDSEGGQAWLDRLIEYIGGVDFIGLDNLMSLTVGDLKEEESWRPMLGWLQSLSRRKIGSLLVNHTGHDTSRDYGTSTRLWQMDNAAVLTKIERPEADLAFRLDFVKARQRTPDNRADYEPVNLVLADDTWTSEPAERQATKGKAPIGYGQAMQILHNLMVDAEPVTPNRDHVTVRAISLETWRNQCTCEGLLERDSKGNIEPTSRQRFGRIKTFAIASHAARIYGDWVWSL